VSISLKKAKAMKLSLMIPIAAASTSAFGQMPQIDTPQGAYRIEYSVSVVDVRNGGKPATGWCSVTEKDGRLLELMEVRGVRHTIEYEDGKSFSSALPVDHRADYSSIVSATLLDGFEILPLGLPLYMPFNFACIETFRPLSDYETQFNKTLPSALEQAKKNGSPDEVLRGIEALGNVRDCNVSIAMGPAADGQGVAPASWSGPDQHGTIRVALGATGRKAYMLEYSDIHRALGVGIPSKILVTTFSSRPDESRAADLRFSFVAREIETDPAKIDAPELERILEKGDWVSYSGRNGAAAGVVFDPKAGSFMEQLAAQLQLKAKHPAPKQPSERPSVAVPLVAATVFAGLAVFFLMLGRKLRAA
jgi:hypothetical protein